MLARRNRGRWSTLAASLGVLALVISVGWLALLWVRDGATVADPRASVLGFLLAAALAAVTLVGWVRRRRAAAAALMTAEQTRQAAATLAEVVAEQWTQEATARSLGDPEPMPVRWRLSATASRVPVMDHPEMIAVSGLNFTGSSERIAELVTAFRRLDRRRLVIIGGPGTGKTTLTVQLLLGLLDHPRPDEPVPVLFSLVGWDPQEQPRLQDWLTDRLERDYPALRAFGVDTARALVECGKILPVLDGLDEVPSTLRPGIITALNDAAFLANRGLILTSRRAEYTEAVASAGDVLTAAAVIAPLALTRIEAASYLRKLLPPDPGATWSAVLSQLETGIAPNLAAVTASPLGLWLVRTVYLDAHRDPTPLVDDTHPDRSAQSTLQAHLLDQLIPAVLHTRPPAPRRRSAGPDAPLLPRRAHNPDDVRKWLTTLAEELRAARTRDWLWWRFARHTFPATHTALTAKLVFG
jgi:NACHT domain